MQDWGNVTQYTKYVVSIYNIVMLYNIQINETGWPKKKNHSFQVGGDMGRHMADWCWCLVETNIIP